MALNFEENTFNGKQVELAPVQTYPLACDIKPVDAVYLRADSLGVDPERKLWVAPDSTAFSADQALAFSEAEEMYRLIVVPRGRWVDVSAGKFNLGKQTGNRLGIDGSIDFKKEGWLRATGLITEDYEREKAEKIIAEKYSILIGASVLAILYDEIVGEMIDGYTD